MPQEFGFLRRCINIDRRMLGKSLNLKIMNHDFPVTNSNTPVPKPSPCGPTIHGAISVHGRAGIRAAQAATFGTLCFAVSGRVRLGNARSSDFSGKSRRDIGACLCACPPGAITWYRLLGGVSHVSRCPRDCNSCILCDSCEKDKETISSAEISYGSFNLPGCTLATHGMNSVCMHSAHVVRLIIAHLLAAQVGVGCAAADVCKVPKNVNSRTSVWREVR